MGIDLNTLLTRKKYRKMSVEKLAFVLNWEVTLDAYMSLKGNSSIDKAKFLIDKWSK